jgi:hypothetical protein
MFRTTSLALVIAAATFSTAAFAGMGMRGGSDLEKRACRHDVTRHCRAVMHESDDRVSQCLSLNAAHISKACQQVLRNHGKL